MGDLVSEGPDEAVRYRSQNFRDLLWNGEGNYFELALEAAVPESLRSQIPPNGYSTVRYEISLGQDKAGQICIRAERVALRPTRKNAPSQRTIFPLLSEPPPSILIAQKVRGTVSVVKKLATGNDYFYPEVRRGKGRGGWVPSFRLGPRKSALANLPEDETRFPVATWLKRLLSDDVQRLFLSSSGMKKPSPPGEPRRFKFDGSNLPWVVHRLEHAHSNRLADWIAHVKTALPDLEQVRTVERKEDHTRYLLLRYSSGVEIPSWLASDGSLRLLALTLPAYLPDFSGVYLIEEPENGIHPRAVETVIQSLSSVYEAQILVASHSPVVLSVVDASKILCFAKTATGATDIVIGSEHPKLRQWKGEENLGVLFAAGVLG